MLALVWSAARDVEGVIDVEAELGYAFDDGVPGPERTIG
jgi:hypothetical protein